MSGSLSRHNAALAGGMILSSAPQTTSVGNLMRPLFEIGIKPARLPAELRDGEAVPQHDIELRFIRRQRQNSVGKGLVVIEIAHCLFRPPDEVVAAWHTFDADAGGR